MTLKSIDKYSKYFLFSLLMVIGFAVLGQSKNKLQKQFDKALINYNQAIKLNPNYAMAYNNRGMVFYNQKLFDRAVENFNKAIKLNPNDAMVYANRGMAELNLGNKEKCCLDFQVAIELGFTPIEQEYNNICR